MKQIIAILVLGAIVVATLFIKSEGFWNIPARAVKVEKVFTNNDVDFWQTPNFQGVLSPRFSNVNYGPYIKADLPSYSHMAVPEHPLGDGSRQTVERFTVEEISQKKMPEGGIPMETTNGSKLPEGGLLASYMSDTGEMKQAVSYDRYLYANKRSRLRAQGDPFRGDLPIVPASGNWFVPSVHPNIDLNEGAMAVMGGINNENTHKLAQLIYATSGGTTSTIAGVDMLVPGERNGFAQMNNITAMSGGSDMIVTSFP